MKKLIGKYLKLTKESDDVFGGDHPNGINAGSTRIQGYLQEAIEPGKQLLLHALPDRSSIRCWTSSVVSFDESTMILKTENSTYSVVAEDQTESAYKIMSGKSE